MNTKLIATAAAFGIAFALASTSFADERRATAHSGQLKSGKRVAGMAFGGISYAQKMGMSLAAGMVGWLLSYFKYEADIVQNTFTLTGIALLLTVIPGVYHHPS